jgi:hypothetical protein
MVAVREFAATEVAITRLSLEGLKCRDLRCHLHRRCKELTPLVHDVSDKEFQLQSCYYLMFSNDA